LSIIIISIEIA
jgi:hypothetical protein